MADLMLIASRMGDHNPPIGYQPEETIDEVWDKIDRRMGDR